MKDKKTRVFQSKSEKNRANMALKFKMLCFRSKLWKSEIPELIGDTAAVVGAPVLLGVDPRVQVRHVPAGPQGRGGGHQRARLHRRPVQQGRQA